MSMLFCLHHPYDHSMLELSPKLELSCSMSMLFCLHHPYDHFMLELSFKLELSPKLELSFKLELSLSTTPFFGHYMFAIKKG
jgi:hypothetical protein